MNNNKVWYIIATDMLDNDTHEVVYPKGSLACHILEENVGDDIDGNVYHFVEAVAIDDVMAAFNTKTNLEVVVFDIPEQALLTIQNSFMLDIFHSLLLAPVSNHPHTDIFL